MKKKLYSSILLVRHIYHNIAVFVIIL